MLAAPFRFSCRLILLLCGVASAPVWADICRVTTAGSVFNNGSSWALPTIGVMPSEQLPL